MSVTVSKAIELDIKRIAIASSGNAGASLAAYATKAGIDCTVLTPWFTPSEKIIQIGIYGPRILKVRGTVDDARKLIDKAENRFNWVPFNTSFLRAYFIEGMKTIAFEIYEQLDRNIPDTIVIPTGSGLSLLGVWKGFKELEEMGIIDKFPRFVAVQTEVIHPIVDVFKGKLPCRKKLRKESQSVATALCISEPPELYLVVNTIKETKGIAITVSDENILKAQVDLVRMEGIFAEPSGAAGIAGLIKLIEKGKVDPDENIVCLVTGSGFHDLRSAKSLFTNPPTIDPTIMDLEQAYSQTNGK